MDEIFRIFSQYPQIKRAFLFGSRAKGNFKPGSDIDLAIEAPQLSFRDITAVHDALEEEAHVPYFFDVVNIKKISSPELKEHIKLCGKEIYHH